MKNFKPIAKKVADFMSNMLFPENLKCMFCNCDIPNFDVKPFCDECENKLPFNLGDRCLICDQPIENEAKVCDFCQHEKRHFKRAFCPFLYDGAVKNAILQFKFSNHRYLAKPFARLIAQQLLASEIQIDIITFVPMTKKKQKERTFNQSKLLAEEVGKMLNIPVLPLLRKVKDVEAQKSLTYKERRENIIGCFEHEQVRLNRNSNILIVDDVITTCATINTCAALLSKRVQSVYVCAVAREYVHPKIINHNSQNLSINEEKRAN